jgi:hypothetical protein
VALHAYVLQASFAVHVTDVAEQKYPPGSGVAVVEKLAWHAASCPDGTCEHCASD